jgi:hypothetical protein
MGTISRRCGDPKMLDLNRREKKFGINNIYEMQ